MSATATLPPPPRRAPRPPVTRRDGSMLSRMRDTPRGEVGVWLTAAGLAVGLVMIIALLGLICYNGMEVFFPRRVALLELVPNAIGAPAGATQLYAEILDDREKAAHGLDAQGQPLPPKREYKLFIGNKDAFGNGFIYLDADQVRDITYPADVLVAERLEYGDALFVPVSLKTAAGAVVPAGTPQFDTQLTALVKEGASRRDALLEVEKHQIGALNRELLDLQLEERGIERRAAGQPPTAAAQARLQQIAVRRTALQGEFDALKAQADALHDAADAATLTYRLASGAERTMPLGNIVYYYSPNAGGFFNRAGIFLHQFWSFLTEEPREANTEGGIFPAIFGTFVMTLLLSAAVTPFGVLAAIYLREYAKQGLLVRTVRIAVNNLAGVPSIVFGVFGLGFFVYTVGAYLDGGSPAPLAAVPWSVLTVGGLLLLTGALTLTMRLNGLAKSNPGMANTFRFANFLLWLTAVSCLGASVYTCPFFPGFFNLALPTPTFGTGGILWAALTLALMTVPVVIVATEEALAAVPRGVREGSLACGASKWQTIQRLVLPASAPGILTGLILAMARGAGEVAPLMLVGVVKLAPTLPLDGEFPFFHLDRKFMHLGFHIYDLGFQSPDSEAARPMVFATTFLLILLVVVLNLGAILIRNHLRKKYQAGVF